MVGGRSARLRGRRYGNEGIGDPVPIIQGVSAQRPEQVVGGLRKPTFTVTKTNLGTPSASSIGRVRPSYALGRNCPGPDLEGHKVRKERVESPAAGGEATWFIPHYVLKRRTDSNYTAVVQSRCKE